MKINFRKFKLDVDVAGQRSTYADVAKDLADGIYKQGQGVVALNLALKIYNSTNDDEEYTDDECAIIRAYAHRFGTPMFIKSLDALLDGKTTDDGGATAISK